MPATSHLSRFLPALVALTLVPASALAQGGQQSPQEEQPPPINQTTDPLLGGFQWRSIGPVGQGGRVDDIEGVESNPSIFYIGFATGGLWKTVNNGTTFEPIFDTHSTHSIGDIAIAPSNPDVLYIGTGEANNRQSSSFGNGMYKSTDAGKTFTQIGLRGTQSIARVVVHPTNPDVVWVAAAGHLFGPNPERGVFKTTDGGRTWNKVLYTDENTGATDIVVNPRNPNELWAAMYTHRRTVFGYASGGPNTGIWKSTDGGEHWTHVTGSGLPRGTMGRIALAISRSNPNVIFAQIEVAPDKEPVQEQPTAGRGGGGGGGGRGQQAPPDSQVTGLWRSLDDGVTWEFLNNQNNRPMYFSQIRVDPNDERVVYTGGLNASKSVDGGKTFETVQNNMGHVDNHAIWIDPTNSQHVMYGNDGSLDVSWDGGAHWESVRLWAVGQPYFVSVDMRRPYWVCAGLQDNGSWCGPSSVRSGNSVATDWYRVGGGDGFYSQIDPTDWTVIYSESQDGSISRVDLKEGASQSIRPRAPRSGRGGGGGGRGGVNVPSNVQPPPDSGTEFRFNWNSPMLLSPHNPSKIYYGGNRLFTSLDRGNTWTMTKDLTRNIDRETRSILGMKLDLPTCGRAHVGACIIARNDGIVSWGTIISISESTIVPGILWVGTDDGLIQVSKDGGTTWTEVAKNLPGGGAREYYVSRVEASYFDPATAWASLDGHKSDDLKPYVYVTHDYGATWTSIVNNLPAMGNVNTIRQDPKNKDLLYVGTEFGFFTSLDAGKTWKPFMTGLPVVRIDDVILHPRDNDLVLATHGRSVWIMDDVTALQQLTQETMAEDAALMQPREAVLWKQDIRERREVPGNKVWQGTNAPEGTALAYYLKSPASDVKLTITDLATGQLFRTMEVTGTAGLHRMQWDLCSDPREVDPSQGFAAFGGGGGGGVCRGGGRGGFGGGGGQQGPRTVSMRAGAGLYKVTLTVNGKEYTKNVSVVDDTWMTMD